MLTILFLGDIVGEPGRSAVIARLPQLKQQYALDFTVVNGENAAAGRGITPKITIDLLRAGAAVVTTGDHIWDQKEIVPYIATEPRLLRPINYPNGAPGAGTIVLETAKGKVGVINVQARTFMQPILENPFEALERAVEEMRRETPVILVDAHGETTSEKIAIGRFLDGRVSAVLGTHTHVQTADEQIFPGGTAFLCDAGMCGPNESILGRAIDPIVGRFISNLPAAFPVARGEVRICGAVVQVDEATGRALSITRVNELIRAPAETGALAAPLRRLLVVFVARVLGIRLVCVLIVGLDREATFAARGRQGRERHGDVAAGDLRIHLDLRHPGEVFLHLVHQLHAEFLVRHLAAAELQLHADLVPLVEEGFAVAELGHVIVLVDVYPELDFLELRPAAFLLLLLLGEVVAELSKVDDFADGRVRRRRHFHQVHPDALRLAKGVGKFHDAELFAGSAHDDPDFASANPAVYTNLWLQIKSSS